MSRIACKIFFAFILLSSVARYGYASDSLVYDWTSQNLPGSAGWSAIAVSSDGTKVVATQSAGSICTSADSGVTWTAQPSAGNGYWVSVASSSDGTKLVAVRYDSESNYLYMSTDSGVTWKQQTGADNGWYAVASSSNGTKLVAANGGFIYTSTDSGETWTQQQGAGNRRWRAVASSSDGTKLVAAVDGGYVYTSADSGVTWTQRASAGELDWCAVASSSDGVTLVATGYRIGEFVIYGSELWTSTDSGETWTKKTNDSPINYQYWTAVASSSDGTRLVAVENNGYIYTSSDSGATWTIQAGDVRHQWGRVASSSDGTRLFATDGFIHTSSDSGASWALQAGPGQVENVFVASSSDGTKLVAATSYICTSADSGATWTQRTSSGTHIWNAVASSSDGVTLVATGVRDSSYTGRLLCTSDDSGATWTEATIAGNHTWNAVASSSNGTMLFAADGVGLARSTDSGKTWSYQSSVALSLVASSSDGTRLVAAKTDGYIYTSADSGTTWAQQTGAGQRTWIAVASSSNGTGLIAAEFSGYIYTSADSGVTWTQQTGIGSVYWRAVASSADGSRLVAASGRYIYISGDSGATWTQQTNYGENYWSSVWISPDGSKIYAGSSLFWTNSGLSQKPLIDSPTFSSPTTTSATLGATIEAGGGTPVTESGIAYFSDEDPFISSSGSKLSNGVVSGQFTVAVAGLISNTIYRYRGFATNSNGTGYTAYGTFTTIADAPVANAATRVASNGFRTNWTYPDGGSDITEFLLDVAIDSGFTTFVSGYKSLSVAGTGQSVTGLTPGTTYWYRVRAVNDGGTSSNSNPISVTTLSLPHLGTPVASSITATTALLGATITSNGDATITASGVAYGIGTNPDLTGSAAATSPTVTSDTFTVNVTGLTANTAYHFRGYATSSLGTGYTDDSTFTTQANAPTATYATGVSATGFTANWAPPSGTAAISGYRLDVATNSGFTSMVVGYSDLSVSGTSKAVTGLPAGGTYYYRVRAVNAGGTGSNSNTITTVLPTASSIALSSPNGGESWKAGAKQTIRWTYTGTPGAKVTIELLKSGSVSAVIASNVPASKGSYAWSLKSTLANGADYQVRVTSTKNSADTATSQSHFVIIGSTITLTSPNGGENWVGRTGLISWNYTGNPGNLKIELLRSGVATTIRPKTPVGRNGTGSFKWAIPKKQASGTDYRVRITSTAIPSCTDTSENNFSIGSVQASAGPDQQVKTSSLVSLSGRNSTGVAVNSASYRWTQTDGPSVELSDLNAVETVFLAPEDAGDKSLGFELTVTNSEGVKSEDSCIVNVSENNPAPIAEAGLSQIVADAQIVELDGSGSTVSGSIVSFSWRQVSGIPVMLTDASAMQTTFVAPAVGAAGESLVFELTVTDQAGLRARDTCIVSVITNDKPPVALAGTSRTVFAGSEVLLDGSGSTDTDNGIATYRWRQVSGKPVLLSAPAGMKTAFIAPDIDSVKEDLVFELTVTDTAGLHDKNKVVITVVPAAGGAGK